MMPRAGWLLALFAMIGSSAAMENDTFQRYMNFAAADLAMLNMGGRALVKAVEDCRSQNPDWDEATIEAYRQRFSADLRAKMEEFLETVLRDEKVSKADIRALQRKHRDQLENNIPREILAQAVQSGAYILNQLDWDCRSSQ